MNKLLLSGAVLLALSGTAYAADLSDVKLSFGLEKGSAVYTLDGTSGGISSLSAKNTFSQTSLGSSIDLMTTAGLSYNFDAENVTASAGAKVATKDSVLPFDLWASAEANYTVAGVDDLTGQPLLVAGKIGADYDVTDALSVGVAASKTWDTDGWTSGVVTKTARISYAVTPSVVLGLSADQIGAADPVATASAKIRF